MENMFNKNKNYESEACLRERHYCKDRLRIVKEIFKTIEKVDPANAGKTAEEFLSAAISEMDADILSAKKEWKPDGHTVKE